MAIYPCDIGMHRYPQPQQSAYITRAIDDDVFTRAQRLCPTHFRALAVNIAEHMDDLEQAGAFSFDCHSCGERADVRVFARLFPSKAEERSFAVEVCGGCWRVLSDRLQFDQGRLLAAR